MVQNRMSLVFIVALILIVPTLFVAYPVEGYQLGQDRRLNRSHASFWGERNGDLSGGAVSIVGDVNGDGFDDFIIGAFGNDAGGSSSGQAYLILGKASGWAMNTDLSEADASFWGEDTYDMAGIPVSGAGDVNGDGFDDFLIAAYGDEDGGTSAGQTYLILGKASGWAMDTDLSAVDASFIGERANDYSGFAISGAGDVNADGYDDFLIGARGFDQWGTDTGMTYLILGKASGWAMDTDLSTVGISFYGESTYDYSGWSVSGAGDVNADGFDDFLIGAWGDDDGGSSAGQAYLILGKASGWARNTALANSQASFRGEDTGDQAGYTLSDAGDVNADGFDDFLIGAHYDDDGGVSAGQTYLILGKASGWAMDRDLSTVSASFRGEDAGDYSSQELSGAGDVNGDGFDDFLIGAYGDDDAGGWAGQAYLILGKASGWAMDRDLSTADASFWGEDADDQAGTGIGGGGDVNGDGFDDILIGAGADEEAGSSAGQTYLILCNCRPPPPRNLQATLSATQPRITLTWDAADTWNEDVTGYRVYRSTNGVDFNQVAFKLPGDRSYVDTDVVHGRLYHYVVVTEDATGALSEWSATVSLYCDKDTDGDGVGDMADDDDDGDGVPDIRDAFPLDNREWLDSDLDGTGNIADTDDDNDGVPDATDAFPLNPVEYIDTDGDGIGDTTDVDADGDGINDDVEVMNALANVQTSLVGLGTAIASMDSDLDSFQSSVTSRFNGLEVDLDDVHSALETTIGDLETTLQTDIGDLETTLWDKLVEVDASLARDLDDLLMTITMDLADVNASLSTELADAVATLQDDLTTLNEWLDLVMQGVNTKLDETNSTLHQQLDELDQNTADFYNLLATDLSTVLTDLAVVGTTLSDENQQTMEDIANLSQLVSDLDERSLSELSALLDALSEDLASVDEGLAERLSSLSGSISDFEATTAVDMDEIDQTLQDLDKLNTILQDLMSMEDYLNRAIDESQSDIESTVEDTGTEQKSQSQLNMALIIAVVLLAVILLVLLLRGGKGEPSPALPPEPEDEIVDVDMQELLLEPEGMQPPPP